MKILINNFYPGVLSAPANGSVGFLGEGDFSGTGVGVSAGLGLSFAFSACAGFSASEGASDDPSVVTWIESRPGLGWKSAG
jgi:hypothetical protein